MSYAYHMVSIAHLMRTFLRYLSHVLEPFTCPPVPHTIVMPLVKAQWLWRPIAALPQPLLPKQVLKIAAPATTALLRLLAEEIGGTFMFHSVNRVADWFH